MGTLMGHVLPGTFFGLFAIWWGICIAIKHFHSRYSKKSSRQIIPYHSTTTFTCQCCPSTYLRQVPFESYLKLICICIGILGETITGFKHEFNSTLNRKSWTFVEVNAQHIVMFFSFGFASFIEILVYAKYALPKGIEFLANIFSFGIEAFLFHFHLHGRDEIDIHVHTLLVYNIAFCFIASIWEYNRPKEILATYCRIAATFLQGIWFYAAGFILYFPSKDPYWIWPANHTSILLITVMFVWFALFVCMFLLIQSACIWSILKRRYHDLNTYNVLENNNDDNDDDDDDDEFPTNKKTDNHQLKSIKPTNGNTRINLNNVDDSDSQVEFEQTRTFASKI